MRVIPAVCKINLVSLVVNNRHMICLILRETQALRHSSQAWKIDAITSVGQHRKPLSVFFQVVFQGRQKALKWFSEGRKRLFNAGRT